MAWLKSIKAYGRPSATTRFWMTPRYPPGLETDSGSDKDMGIAEVEDGTRVEGSESVSDKQMGFGGFEDGTLKEGSETADQPIPVTTSVSDSVSDFNTGSLVVKTDLSGGSKIADQQIPVPTSVSDFMSDSNTGSLVVKTELSGVEESRYFASPCSELGILASVGKDVPPTERFGYVVKTVWI